MIGVNQSEVKPNPPPPKKRPNPIVSLLHAFSRAWCHLRIFESTSDWFIVLLALPVSTGCFGFGFKTPNIKPLKGIIFST